MALNGFNPSSEQDIALLIRQTEVRNEERFLESQRAAAEAQRAATQAQQEAAMLRSQLSDVVATQHQQQATGQQQNLWDSSDWARNYGGSPQTTPPPAQSQQDLDRLVDQRIAQREQEQRQQEAQLEAQRKADGDRLLRKFEAEHPQLAQDNTFRLRLAAYWRDAEIMNHRAAPQNRMNADQLYQAVVSSMVNTYQAEQALRQQAEQQYLAQQQQQMTGPNALRDRTSFGQQMQGDPIHQALAQQGGLMPPAHQQAGYNTPGPAYGQQYQDPTTGQTMTGAQKVPRPDLQQQVARPGQIPYTSAGPGYNPPTAPQQAEISFGGGNDFQSRVDAHNARRYRGAYPGFAQHV